MTDQPKLSALARYQREACEGCAKGYMIQSAGWHWIPIADRATFGGAHSRESGSEAR